MTEIELKQQKRREKAQARKLSKNKINSRNYTIQRGTKTVDDIICEPPKINETIRLNSLGDFDSVNIIDFIANKETIEELKIITFSVGEKAIKHLDRRKQQGKIGDVYFVVPPFFIGEGRNDKQEKDYAKVFKQICDKNKWVYREEKNHAKVTLMKTKDNYYVLETSSNLNHNPKSEMFILSNDIEIYKFHEDFYKVGDLNGQN